MSDGARPDTPERWPSGATIVVHEVWHGRLWSARPQTVVEDARDRLVLWCPRGTRWRTATTPPTRPRAATRAERFVASLTAGDWVLGEFIWDVSTLVLVRPGDWHAVWVCWKETGEPWGWYINLQRPFRRTKHGLQTMDLMLDVIVDLDRRWRWKDEDEFAALVAARLIKEDEARQVRVEGEHVIAQLAANVVPFSERWHEWRPDPQWATPELPQYWERVETADHREVRLPPT